MYSRASKLRDEAARIRAAAAVPTSGGHMTKRLLLGIAKRLEMQADELERDAERK
jgi:hypothetical protein